MNGGAVERLEEAGPVRRGVLVWFAVFGGVAAWTVHLVATASLARWTYTSGHEWILHAITAACIVVTLVATGLSWRVRRATRTADESGPGDGDQLLFLGTLGVVFGITNLALIAIEGAYAAALYGPHTLR